MKVKYKGYEIDVEREKCLGGWGMLYFSVYRIDDGIECICDFEDSAEKVRDKVNELKGRIDEELKKEHPWGVRYDVCPHGVPYDGPQCNDCSW